VLCTSREPLVRDSAPVRRKPSLEDHVGRIVSQEHQISRGSKLYVVAGE
jgi:hypothetical protein